MYRISSIHRHSPFVAGEIAAVDLEELKKKTWHALRASFNGERHERQFRCAGPEKTLIISPPFAETSVDARPLSAFDSRFRVVT
jgi:hypothetical protein